MEVADTQARQGPSAPAVVETRVFSLNTRDADRFVNGTKKSDVFFTIPGFVSGLSDVAFVTMKVQSVRVPNVFYNLPQKESFYCTYTNIGGGFVENMFITVPAGYYDIYSLLDLVNKQIAGVIGFNIAEFVYSNNTNLVTLQFTDMVDSVFTASWRNTLKVMGFSEAQTTNSGVYGFPPTVQLHSIIAGTNSVTAEFFPDLNGVTSLFVRSPQIPTQNYSTEMGGSFFVNIPITSDFSYATNYDFSSASPFLVPSSVLIDAMELQLLDQDANLVDLKNNDWSIVFEVQYSRTNVPAFESVADALKRLLIQAKYHEDMKAQEEDEEKAKTEFIITEIPLVNSSGAPYFIQVAGPGQLNEDVRAERSV